MSPIAPPSHELARALSWLSSFTDYEQRMPAHGARGAFDLERFRAFLGLLDRPHGGLRVIHVAGTKGKGTVVHAVESIARAHGLRTLRYTSPHVERLNERIALDGIPVADDRLAAMLFSLRESAERAAATDDGQAPTFFEMMTAAAFMLARDDHVDAAIVEVGIGGRLDATNVVDPVASVITSVDLDHVALLGTTHAAIAREKAGIVKPGRPVLSGLTREEPGFDAIAEAAAASTAPLCHAGRDLVVHHAIPAWVESQVPGIRAGGQVVGFDVPAFVMPGAGRHQAMNALLALAAARILVTEAGRRFDVACAVAALARVTLPARCEFISGRPDILIDGAHTPASVAGVVDMVRELLPGRRTVALIGLTADRDPEAVFAPLGDLIHEAVCVPLPSPRSASPSELLLAWRRLGQDGSEAVDARSGLAVACRRAGPGGLVVIAGSFVLAGAVRSDCYDRRGGDSCPQAR